MHAARLSHSPRLRKVHDYLADGEERTTLEIISATGKCAVNSIVAELRDNGCQITCRRQGDVWYYRLVSSPFAESAPA